MSVMCSRPSTPPRSMKAPKSAMFLTTPFRTWPTWSSFIRTSRLVLRSASSSTRRLTTMLRRRLQSFEFKIIKLNKRRRNIVVSRRVLLESERKTKRDVLMKELQVSQVRKGIVKNITDFGAFIDLGGVDGLLHITDMSYGRVSHPSELVHIGQELEVKVLDIDWER